MKKTDLKKYIIIAGKESKDIADELSELLDSANVYHVEKKSFPDEEFLIRVPIEIKDKNVIYIKSTSHPVSENVLELFFTIDLLVRKKVNKIILIMPYFGFARQDKDSKKESEKGQCISASTILKTITFLGQGHLEAMHFVDLHFCRDIGPFSVPDVIKKMEADKN